MRLKTAIRKRVDSIDTENYARSVKAGLQSFLSWAQSQHLEGLGDVDDHHLVRWVEDPDDGLRGRLDDDDLSPRTAQQYYAYVRASWTWWVKMGYADQNPAKNAAAEQELPEPTTEPDRQFWTQRQIQQLRSYADRRVDEALDAGDEHDVLHSMRDRTIFLLLAFSGARSAELFRDSADTARDGVTWDHLDWDQGLIAVLGKSREQENAMFPEAVQPPIQRYGKQLDPVGDWPVVPTLDAGTLSSHLRTRLGRRGWDDHEITERLDGSQPLAVCRDESVAPPGLSTRSARRVMKTLCEGADVDIDGGYLKPHGGRRGLGNRLYEEKAELAQKYLRHKSIRTTHDAYEDQRDAETRERAEDILFD